MRLMTEQELTSLGRLLDYSSMDEYRDWLETGPEERLLPHIWKDILALRHYLGWDDPEDENASVYDY